MNIFNVYGVCICVYNFFISIKIQNYVYFSFNFLFKHFLYATIVWMYDLK